MRLLITGASGLLGLNLSLLANIFEYDVTGLVHSHQLKGVPFDVCQVDLLDTPRALSVIEKTHPDGIIHCAAIANLQVAERTPSLAYQMNVEVPGKIAEAAYSWGVPFLHISTDAVFDGKRGGYTEMDPPNPQSVYATSKLAGEHAVQEEHPDALIARVVFYGWSLSGRRSLSEFFYNNLKDGKSIQGFIDTYFCPLYVEHLAEILLRMIKHNLKGIYHVVSPENLSKYEFGVRIAKKFGFDPDLIEPVRMSEIDREAPRSLNLILKPDKLQRALGYRLPPVDSGIDRLFEHWVEGYHLELQNFSSERIS